VSERKSFTLDEARRIGEDIGLDWASAPFDAEQFRMGLDVELEHGLHDLATNVTDDHPVVTEGAGRHASFDDTETIVYVLCMLRQEHRGCRFPMSVRRYPIGSRIERAGSSVSQVDSWTASTVLERSARWLSAPIASKQAKDRVGWSIPRALRLAFGTLA
jgi:hypothetical protein